MRVVFVGVGLLVAGCIGDSEALFSNGLADGAADRSPARPGVVVAAPEVTEAHAPPAKRPAPVSPRAPDDEPTGPRVIASGGRPVALSCEDATAVWIDAATGDVVRSVDGAASIVASSVALGAIDSAVVGANVFVATGDRILMVRMSTGATRSFAETPGLRAFRFVGGLLYWSDDRGVSDQYTRIIDSDGQPVFAADSTGVCVVRPDDSILRHFSLYGKEIGEIAPVDGVGVNGVAVAWPKAFWASASGLHYGSVDGGYIDQLGGPAARVVVDGHRVIRANAIGETSKILSLDGITMVDSGIWSGSTVTGLAACSGVIYWTTETGQVWSTTL